MTLNTQTEETQTHEGQSIMTCSNCHVSDSALDYLEHEGRNLCADCYSDLVSSCGGCSRPFWRDDMTSITGKLYCENCTVECFRCCSSCEEYVEQEQAYFSEIHDTYYCENCFSEYVTYCISCDGQIDPQNCRINEDGDCFCDDCWEHRDDPEHGEYLEFYGESFKRCVSKRKYGIEIEACLNDGEKHLTSDRAGCWRQLHDGSLGDTGREYVSPIFHGDQGFDEIEKFTTVLKEWGYFVRRQCGLHIHVDGRDLTCADIKMLLKVTRYFEPVLYAMLPQSRYEGTYSVPLEKFPKSRFRIKASDEEALKRFWYGKKEASVNLKSKYHHSRYYGLNIHSWFYRRSLEFRYHSGTLNPVKITNFITVCQAFVDRAKETKRFNKVRPCDFREHFENFVSFLQLTPELALYIRKRIMKFHPDRFPTEAVNAA